jgi:acetoin utilization protein AcuB
MTPDPFFGTPEMPVTEIQELMRGKHFRHLPILGDDGSLVGLVTQRTLLKALPSDVSGFSRFEVDYLLSKTKARDVMVKSIRTIDDNLAVEEAARIMADEKIGCLPVCHEGKMVGIITDNDLFGIMVDLMGTRRPGIRMMISQPDKAGAVARLASAIAEDGGFMSVFFGYQGPVQDTWISICKVQNLSEEKLRKIINDLPDTTLINIRETKESSGEPESV